MFSEVSGSILAAFNLLIDRRKGAFLWKNRNSAQIAGLTWNVFGSSTGRRFFEAAGPQDLGKAADLLYNTFKAALLPEDGEKYNVEVIFWFPKNQLCQFSGAVDEWIIVLKVSLCS